MKIGYSIIAVLTCLTVLFGGMYLQVKGETRAVNEVLSIDEKILELRVTKFAKCGEITRVDLDKLDAIVKTCGEHLSLK